MMRLLFYATSFIAFSHLKDAVFLYEGWKNSLVLNDFVRTVDMVFIPLICAFFIEAISPGRITDRQLKIVVGFQSSFILLFLLFPVEPVALAAMTVAYLMAFVTIVYVLYVSINVLRCLSTDYSSIENIDMIWISVFCVVFFFSLFFYGIAFENTTWLSESLYNLFSIVFCSFLVILAKRHKIVNLILSKETIGKEDGKAVEEHILSSRDEVATKLKKHMESSKSYLDPCVTLSDIAQAIGTNRTYLSDYLNNTLNTTFYDYINTFRIDEACRIIETMPKEDRISMEEVSKMSGFKSKSTFHRYFIKVKGISPKQYFLTKRAISSTTRKPSNNTPNP